MSYGSTNSPRTVYVANATSCSCRRPLSQPRLINSDPYEVRSSLDPTALRQVTVGALVGAGAGDVVAFDATYGLQVSVGTRVEGSSIVYLL